MSINYAVSALKTSWRTVVQINRTVQLLELKFYFESSQHWVTVRAWQRIARNTNFGSVKLKFYGGQHLSWSATLLTSTLLLHSYKVATCYVSLQQQVISRHARRGLHRESNKKMFHDHIILLSYLINDLLLSFEKQNCIDDLDYWTDIFVKFAESRFCFNDLLSHEVRPSRCRAWWNKRFEVFIVHKLAAQNSWTVLNMASIILLNVTFKMSGR